MPERTVLLRRLGVYSGTCGKNVNGALDDSGLPAISGTGAMDDFSSGGIATAEPYNHRVITNTLTLPASLTIIESDAFTGLSSVAVSIPATVTSIADDAFDAGIVIIAPAGSYAETWGKDHRFTVNHP